MGSRGLEVGTRERGEVRGSSVEVLGRETDGGSGVPIEKRRGRYPIGRGSMQVKGDGCGSKPSRGLAGRIEVQPARGFGCGDRVYRAADRGGDPGGAAVAEVDRGWVNTAEGERQGLVWRGRVSSKTQGCEAWLSRPAWGGRGWREARMKRWAKDDGRPEYSRSIRSCVVLEKG